MKKTNKVFVLVDSSLYECGASVYHNEDDLYNAARNDYELDNSEMNELIANKKFELGESTLFVIKTTIV